MPHAWLTPDEEIPAEIICRGLRIPAEFVTAVNGALYKLTQQFSWEKYGDIDPEDAAETMLTMWSEYLQSGDTCMIGMIAPFFRATLPDGWIKSDGSTYDRADYPLLWEVWPPTLRDATTFTTVNLGGRVLVMDGSGPGLTTRNLADGGGFEELPLTPGMLPAHTHNITPQSALPIPIEPGVPVNVYQPAGVTVTSSAGNNDPVPLMQPWFTPNFGIKAK